MQRELCVHAGLLACLLAIVFSSVAQSTDAHDPGQEYTYLRMFTRDDGMTSGTMHETGMSINKFARAGSTQKGYSPNNEISRLLTRHLLADDLTRSKRVRDVNDGDIWEKPDFSDVVPHVRRMVLSTSDKKVTQVARKSKDGGAYAGKRKQEKDGDADDEISERQSLHNLKSKSVLRSESTKSVAAGSGKAARNDTKDFRDGRKTVKRKIIKSSTKPFQGVGAVKDGEDIMRVSFMLMRILKQYNIKSIVDVPCRAHASWMHKFLTYAIADIPDLSYVCVDTNKEILKAVRQRVGGNANAKFLLRQFWTDQLPEAELVLSWAGLDSMRKENVLKFIKKIATSNRHKYFAVGSHANGSKLTASNVSPLNVRRKPFNLPPPLRVISKLSEGAVKKQLYVYRIADMRKAFE
jgi:hypothetical protein